MSDNWVQAHLFDGSGPHLAAQGMSRVLKREEQWTLETMRRTVPYLEYHPTITADDMWFNRLWPWRPHHDNAIGAFFNHLIATGYLVDTGKTMRSRRTNRHAGLNKVYRSLIYRGRAA